MSIYAAFCAELTKLATAIETASGAEIHLKAPNMRYIAQMRDPGSAGYVRPKTSLRIAGGARNVGVKLPPTLSSGRSAAQKAQTVRASAGRRSPGFIPTPVM